MGNCNIDVSEENGNAFNESEALAMETIFEANLGEHKKKMKIEPKEGKISQLPDEVLVSILSLLPTTQSVRTSILAKRWKNLWKSVQHLDLIFRSYNFSDFRFLKSSTIHGKNVMNRYSIDHIVSKCPFLEEFRLVGSNVAFNPVIVSASLKKLEILGCCNMRKLELSAPNLVSFKYNGPDIKYVFGDVPRLVEVSFVDSYCVPLVTREFEQFEAILYQLVRVNLILDFPWIKGFPLVSGLAHMKELRLDIRVWDTMNPLFLAWSVLVGMPFLDTFILRLFWPENHEVLNLGGVEFDEFGQGYTFKVFEMDGCISAGFELEFVKFVVDRAISLKKLVVRVARRASVESEEDLMDSQEREEAIEKAREYVTSILSRPTCFVLL